MPKLNSGPLKLSIIHFLRAGIFVPIVFSFIFTLVIVLLAPNLGLKENSLQMTILSLIPLWSGAWLGVIYSAKNIKINYVVNESKQIIIQSTLILFVLTISSVITTLIELKAFNTLVLVETFRVIGMIVIFYYVSTKYLTDDIVTN